MKDVMKTIFWTALVSYVFFAFADFWRPGFVSDIFSVHWFLAVTIISGILLIFIPASSRFKPADQWFAPYLLATFIGLLSAMMVWRIGTVFGDWRVFLSLVSLVAPSVLLSLFKTDVI